MLDTLMEAARAVIVLIILVLVMRKDKLIIHGRTGWNCVKAGVVLLLLGTLVDITDGFPSLNWTIVFGDTDAQAFIEDVIGYLGGYVLIGIGIWLWLQKIQKTGSLEQAENRHKKLFAQSPVAITHGYVDPNKGPVWANKEAAKMLGYESADELDPHLSMSTTDEIIPNKKLAASLKEAMLRKDRLSNLELPVLRKDGTQGWVLCDMSVEKDKDGIGEYFYAFGQDITKRKNAEHALQQSEKHLKTLIEHLPVGIYLVRLKDRTIREVNPAGLEMTGYSRKEIVGHQCHEILCTQKGHQCQTLIDGLFTHAMESECLRKDGTCFPVLQTAVKLSVGDEPHLLETFIDISEHKRLEQLKEDVDRIVQHELRSPIASLVNAATIVLMDKDVQGESRELIETIKLRGRKALDMMNFSLALFKIESGTYEYQPETLDLADALRHVLNESSEAFRLRHTSADVSINGKPLDSSASLLMPGNAMLIHSMLSNLLINAADAANGEPVAVEILSNGTVTIAITNPGTVPLDIRERFFEKYVTAGKSGGTGLGSYAAHRVAKIMGGTMEMQTSDSENRTTITVHLPA